MTQPTDTTVSAKKKRAPTIREEFVRQAILAFLDAVPVEFVARRICAYDRSWQKADVDEHWQDYEDNARAAIAEIRIRAEESV